MWYTFCDHAAVHKICARCYSIILFRWKGARKWYASKLLLFEETSRWIQLKSVTSLVHFLFLFIHLFSSLSLYLSIYLFLSAFLLSFFVCLRVRFFFSPFCFDYPMNIERAQRVLNRRIGAVFFDHTCMSCSCRRLPSSYWSWSVSWDGLVSGRGYISLFFFCRSEYSSDLVAADVVWLMAAVHRWGRTKASGIDYSV